ncbi:MAG: putative rane protein [Solirubrobacterales bacterium]|nr:putative rane protein [Solirubrobacterales bacterium]
MAEAGKTPSEGWDAMRRTRLAAERTELAWWRTALTSIAVAVGVGRVVPELSGTTTKGPYVIVGIGWALYSVALFGYGSIRSRRVETAVDKGEMLPSSRIETRWLMSFGVVLCLATVGLIAASA